MAFFLWEDLPSPITSVRENRSKERGNALHKKREGANGGPFKKCDKTMKGISQTLGIKFEIVLSTAKPLKQKFLRMIENVNKILISGKEC